ncbi:hypothetical protein ES319_D11G284600v1 [Gossypium barbadense]|uniref:Transmembrane protein n=1 Tax=Gossypium barbadense TaxID=3634 RepID=A0A5J5PJH3_GOSBA|nr:hypothetical protein ES319_D11G284600v1 [Gossypium barbadense]
MYLTSLTHHFSYHQHSKPFVFSNMPSLKLTVTFLFCIILLFPYQHVSAIRPIPHVEDQLFAAIFNKNLIIQVLQRGTVPPSGGNPCTNIPGRSGGGC